MLAAVSALALTFAGGAPALAQNDAPGLRGLLSGEDPTRAPILLEADELTFNAETRLWAADGNVEASQNGRVVRADLVTYDEATGKLIASGNVTLAQEGGPTVYAERIEITGEFKTGIVESLRLVLDQNSRLAAARAVRQEDGVTIMEKAVYSPCKVCNEGDTPTWQIKASRVTHDQENKSISYRHARFEVYGVPVVYMPYFSHPDPTVKRKTGFLPPSIGNSTELGTLVEIPYFINLKPNMDVTLSPLFTGREGVVAKGEFRHRTTTGDYELNGSIANARFFDEAKDEFTGRRVRGHLFGEGDFQITPQKNWGFLLQTTTDDTYLRRFDISEEDRLTNNIYFRNLKAQGRTVYNGYFFDGLRAEDDDETTPIVPVLAEHRSVFDDPFLGGQVMLDANALTLYRTGEPEIGRIFTDQDRDLNTNTSDTQRLSFAGTWSRPFVSSWGDVLTTTAHLRGDMYYTRDVERRIAIADDPGTLDVIEEFQIAGRDEFTQTRMLGYAAVDWRWPFVRGNGRSRQVIEPVAQLIYSPYGGNPDRIINEDSVSFEFDDTNVLRTNKFPGLDQWESGPRANVGLRFASYGDTISADVLVGQTYRLRPEDEFAQGSGLEDERSDYVGRIALDWGDHVNVTHRFRLDKDSFDFQRNEVDLDINTKYLDLKAGYLSLDESAAAATEGLDAREEIRLEARTRFTNSWSARIGGRRDLEDGEMISNFASLIYQDECLQLEGSYRRNFTRDRDIEPSTSVLFRVRLKSVGG